MLIKQPSFYKAAHPLVFLLPVVLKIPDTARIPLPPLFKAVLQVNQVILPGKTETIWHREEPSPTRCIVSLKNFLFPLKYIIRGSCVFLLEMSPNCEGGFKLIQTMRLLKVKSMISRCAFWLELLSCLHSITQKASLRCWESCWHN